LGKRFILLFSSGINLTKSAASKICLLAYLFEATKLGIFYGCSITAKKCSKKKRGYPFGAASSFSSGWRLGGVLIIL
jgi:hypothetical protein